MPQEIPSPKLQKSNQKLIFLPFIYCTTRARHAIIYDNYYITQKFGAMLMNTSSIGKQIRKYRESKGWRQEDFAEKLGLSVTYIGMIERGEKVPKLETFIKIANVLSVSADLLLYDVLDTGYRVKMSEMTKDISRLPISEQERIFAVVNAMIDFENK